MAVDTKWLDEREMAAWVSLAAVLELLPGVLDSQLRHDAGLSHFEYFALAMLSDAPHRTLRMTALAAQTNATLPRLSHVAQRLEGGRGLVERFPCPDDARATNVRLTATGLAQGTRGPRPATWRTFELTLSTRSAPSRSTNWRDVTKAILGRLDPDATVAATYR